MYRYDVTLPKELMDRAVGNKQSICESIMVNAQFPPETWRIGKTKVFMKESDMVNKHAASVFISVTTEKK